MFLSIPPINTSVSVAPVSSLAFSTTSKVSLINFDIWVLSLFSVWILTNTLSSITSTFMSSEEVFSLIVSANCFAFITSFEVLLLLPSSISDFISKFF